MCTPEGRDVLVGAEGEGKPPDIQLWFTLVIAGNVVVMQENPGGCNSSRYATVSTRCMFSLFTLYMLVDVCTHTAKTSRRVGGQTWKQATCNPEGGRRVGGHNQTQATSNPEGGGELGERLGHRLRVTQEVVGELAERLGHRLRATQEAEMLWWELKKKVRFLNFSFFGSHLSLQGI